MVDITERKRAEAEYRRLEQQFQQAQKLESLGRLAGGVAHDFNNLLTIINGYGDLLLWQLPQPGPLRDRVAEIRKAGQRATELTRQLLAFSRRQEVQPAVVDLNAAVRDAEKMLGRLIGEDVTLTCRLNAQPGTVKVDPGQFNQVLMNLVVNARDAMPQGGVLTIETATVALDGSQGGGFTAAPPSRYFLLTVSDTGIGMDEEVKRRLFEPFFTTKEVGKGSGLGLSTVYGIVRQSGGWIGVDSEPGRGTTFRVYLPLAVEAASQAPEPAQSTLEGHETVLVVEDEPAVRDLACLALRLRGYQVLEAANGDDAVAISTRHPGPIDLVLTDVIMPGIAGRELVERLRVQRPEARVLFMSGYAGDEMSRGGVPETGTPYLQKPFDAQSLAASVREALG
jgi:nitrogen-specific signal transduction histidine kinase